MLGLALLGLAALDTPRETRLLSALEVFGRVPLFYYVAHLYLLHGAAVLLGRRTSLLGVYVAWALGVLLLYPQCRWFAALKSRRRDVWMLRYL